MPENPAESFIEKKKGQDNLLDFWIHKHSFGFELLYYMYGFLVDLLVGVHLLAGSSWVAYDELQHFREYLEVVVFDSFPRGSEMEHNFLKNQPSYDTWFD